ncbi:MAG: hypothetical protein ABI654_04830 [Betaproteobacteria bacterium]
MTMLRLALVLLLLLAGCAAVQPISDAERKKIAGVTINGTVAKPPVMSYLGPGGAGGLMFGAIGGALAAPSIEQSRKSFQEYVDRNGISIEKIVLEEMSAAIRSSGKFPLAASPAAGGAVIDISIVQYGFSIPHGFSSKLVPTLFIRCDMKDAAGRVIWTSSDRVLPLGNPVEAVEPAAIQSDPRAMEGSWRAAAKHIAMAIVAGY